MWFKFFLLIYLINLIIGEIETIPYEVAQTEEVSLVQTDFDQISAEAKFEEFTKNFSKLYRTENEHKVACENFVSRLKAINPHNERFMKREEKYQQGINEFSDLSVDDFNDKINGFIVTVLNKKALTEQELNAIVIPSSLNYTALGHVTAVRNQGLCGSCWTFSVTGALEGQYFKKTGKLTKLSEQNLIDCNKDLIYGNFGCNGGNSLIAYNFVKNNNGITTSALYPYRASDIFSCTFNPAYSVTSVANYELLPPGNETLVLQYLVAIGPLAAAMDSSLLSFQNYLSGVYSDPLCTRILNHAVLIVGFGTDNNYNPPVDYWIIKNSYGLTWGERGYMKLIRGVNLCGIADYVTYPLV